VPVLYLLDEFAALGHLAPVERAMGLMAGYGVQLWPILQDVHQLRATYGQRAGTFLSNAGVLQVFGVNDHDSARLVSDLLGQETAVFQTMSRALDSEKSGISYGEQHTARPLLTPDEVRNLPQNVELLFLAGQRPIVAGKLAYYADDVTGVPGALCIGERVRLRAGAACAARPHAQALAYLAIYVSTCIRLDRRQSVLCQNGRKPGLGHRLNCRALCICELAKALPVRSPDLDRKRDSLAPSPLSPRRRDFHDRAVVLDRCKAGGFRAGPRAGEGREAGCFLCHRFRSFNTLFTYLAIYVLRCP
jgi:hypothetical protein